MEKIMKIYIIEAGYTHDGTCGGWVFTDKASALAKFEEVAAAIRKEDGWEQGDYVQCRGPFTEGENTYDADRTIAYCNPVLEVAKAAKKASKAKRKKAA